MSTKASNFTDADALTGNELFPLIQGGNRKVTLNTIAGFLATGTANAIISGCQVTYDSGLTFNISAGNYRIGNVSYSYAGGSITLDNADATYPRLDVIAVDAGGVIKITGTPADDPQKPTVNPATQLELTVVFINAGATSVDNDISLFGDVLGYNVGGNIRTRLRDIIPTVMGSYTNANITVDSKGRVISASNGVSNTDQLPEGSTNLYFTNTRAQTALASQLAMKANDNDVLHLTGDEFAAGKKTFTELLAVSRVSETGYLFKNTASGTNWAIIGSKNEYGDFAIMQSTANMGDPLTGRIRAYFSAYSGFGIGTTSTKIGDGTYAAYSVMQTDSVSGGLLVLRKPDTTNFLNALYLQDKNLNAGWFWGTDIDGNAIINHGAGGNETETINIARSADVAFKINPTTKNIITFGALTIGAYTLPTTDGAEGQVIKTDGAGVLGWASISSELPSMSGNANKWLTNDGTNPVWAVNTGWSTSGNALTDPATHFLGTTDNKNISFRINNNPVGLLTPTSFSFGDINAAVGATWMKVSPNKLEFINNGNYYNTIQFNSGNLFCTNINGDISPIITSKLITSVIQANDPQWSTMTFLGQRIIGDLKAFVFNTFSGDRLTIFDTNVGGNADIEMIPSGNGSLRIGTTENIPSSILTLVSTNKGFLPPRMTATQAETISSPAEGLLVYSTDGIGSVITSKGWWGYDGSTWQKIN